MLSRFFYLTIFGILFLAVNAGADDCRAEKDMSVDGKYKGCNTLVNGHKNYSNEDGISEYGCETFCDSLIYTAREKEESEYSPAKRIGN